MQEIQVMKKIVFIGLIVCVLSSCAIFRTKEVTISNNSDYKAYIAVTEFRRNGDLAGSSGGVDYIELLAHTSTTYKLYDNGDVRLTKPNRNFLKKNSNQSYEVLNSPRKVIQVFNRTREVVTLYEANNLFDKIEIPKNQENDEAKYTEIEVFTIDNFCPCAITEKAGIVLKTSVQDNNLIITF